MSKMKENRPEPYREGESEKLAKMAAVGDIAAAMAHDIKNSLAGIGGALQIFAEDFPPGDPRNEVIREVMGNIERIDRCVKDLLWFARPPSPRLIDASVMPVIEQAKALVSGQTAKRNIEVIIPEQAEIGPLRLDTEQLRLALANIMLNALYTMPDGGALRVTTRRMEDAHEAEIAISDNGEGIEPEALKDIFKPVFVKKQPGRGLGMAISNGIVARHGGRITVESRVGAGSIYRVILPLG
jgi:signal transduction histidine kinase